MEEVSALLASKMLAPDLGVRSALAPVATVKPDQEAPANPSAGLEPTARLSN